MILRTLVLSALSASVVGVALAGSPSTPTPPAKSAPRVVAVSHATGVVKAWDAANHQLTVTVNGHDTSYNLGTLKLDPAVKAGSSVDLTFSGPTVTGVAIHH